MSAAQLESDTRNWKDRFWPLLLWTALLALFFRPVFMSDLAGLKQEGGPWNLAADLAAFVILLFTIWNLVLGRIGSIAYNTFREAVRNRILYFILFFALILMAASGVVKELAIAAQERIVMNIGLASISFFGLMAAVFVGISLVYNELEKKTIYTIVSKPVHRHQFLLGKYFGLLLTLFVIVAIMALFFFMVFNYQALTSDEALENVLWHQTAEGWKPVENPGLTKILFLGKAAGTAFIQGIGNMLGFAVGAVSPNLLIAVAMTGLELMIVTALAVLFSSFSTPTLSAVFTVMIFLAGRLNEDILRFGNRLVQEAMKNQGVVQFDHLDSATQIKSVVVHALALIVPNLDSLNITNQVVIAESLSVWRYGVLYSFLYTATLLMLAILIFRRRNFK